jgi:hypothetical protein
MKGRSSGPIAVANDGAAHDPHVATLGQEAEARASVRAVIGEAVPRAQVSAVREESGAMTGRAGTAARCGHGEKRPRLCQSWRCH